MPRRLRRKPRMSDSLTHRTRPRHEAHVRLFSAQNLVTTSRARVVAVFAVVAAVLALGFASTALADSPIQNAYFKDPSGAGVNAGTDLSGWTTSAPGQTISTFCFKGRFPALCVPETGTTIPVLGLAGTPTPPQEFLSAGQGTPGVANKKFTAMDIYNGDPEWLSENPAGNIISQQSNYALVPTSCQGGRPAPNTLSQTFFAHKDQVLTGFSFFTSKDWVPDSGSVTVTPPGGSPQPVYVGRIVGDSDQAAAGSWDHPVPPTVHQNNAGTWVKPHGDPADATWIAQHNAGVSATPWTRW